MLGFYFQANLLYAHLFTVFILTIDDSSLTVHDSRFMLLQNSGGSVSNRVIDNAENIKNVTWDSINNLITSIFATLPKIVAGMLVLLIFWLLAKIIKSIFWSFTKHARLDNRLRLLFSRLIVVFIVTLGIFTSLTVVIENFKFSDLIATLGFTSFIIGFATKDILNNLLSGVLILWQQPFKIGDYIFLKDNQGEVEFIGVRATNLRKDDGELVLIPNGDMYSSALTIRGAGAERRMLLKISIGYNDDIGKAKETIKTVLAKTEGVVSEPKANVVVTDLSAEGVKLSIYFWLNTDKSSPLAVFDRVATDVKKALCDRKIELYPPGSLIVQNANEHNAPPVNEQKKDDFES